MLLLTQSHLCVFVKVTVYHQVSNFLQFLDFWVKVVVEE